LKFRKIGALLSIYSESSMNIRKRVWSSWFRKIRMKLGEE